MRGVLLRWLVLTAAVLAASWLLDGIRVDGLLPAFLAAAMLGILNAFFRPLLILLTLPINILTLGLFTFLINALMLKIVSAVISGFTVHGFWTAVIGALIIGSTGFVIKRLRAMELTTITEFFEVRFDRRCRVTAGAICAAAGILNMGLFPKMGATYLAYATGLAGRFEHPQVIVNLIMSLMIVVVLIYTVMGGMVSVIVTDYLQFALLGIGMVVATVLVFSQPGLGWNRPWTRWPSTKAPLPSTRCTRTAMAG